MNLYSHYFRKHILWLQDGFRHYYVQRPGLSRREITDVKLKLLRNRHDAIGWLESCAQYNDFYTRLHARAFLAEHSLCHEPVFRYDDRTVFVKVADMLCTQRYAIVEKPKAYRNAVTVAQGTIFVHILGRKPGEVHAWGNGEFTRNASSYAHALTHEEQAYLDHFDLKRIEADSLTDKQAKEAADLFGDDSRARARYTKWRSRARIINHYKFTHPVTLAGLMGAYRLARDANPIHFALERGWQIGSGKEMFTGQKVSRVQAGLELLLSIGVVKLLSLRVKPAAMEKSPTPAEPAATSARKSAPEPETANNIRRKDVDIEKPKGYGNNAYDGSTKSVPHGFSSADDFSQFRQNLRSGLNKAGFDNVQSLFQGSSVTGNSFRTGQPFDVGRVSDFDIALVSPQMLQKANQLGIPLRSQGVRTAPLKPIHLEKLGLTDIASQLSKQAGRPVNFMIFDSTATATAKAPSILVP